jgi:hypothetical protein
MPVPALLCKSPNRRRLHRRAFKSVFVNPPRPAPFKFYLSEREYAQTIGTTERMIRKWREQWKRTGYGPGVRPESFDGVHWRYAWEAVTQNTEGTWLNMLKADRSTPTRHR